MKKYLAPAAIALFVVGALPAMAEDVKAGGDLYADNCAICHGGKGQGYPKEVVPDGAVRIKRLAGDSAYWDFAVFKAAVVDGKDDHGKDMKVMPVFGKSGLYEPPGQAITEDDVKNIQAFLKTLGPKE